MEGNCLFTHIFFKITFVFSRSIILRGRGVISMDLYSWFQCVSVNFNLTYQHNPIAINYYFNKLANN